jgi:orotate phosphoribosyltransferase-like protein
LGDNLVGTCLHLAAAHDSSELRAEALGLLKEVLAAELDISEEVLDWHQQKVRKHIKTHSIGWAVIRVEGYRIIGIANRFQQYCAARKHHIPPCQSS